MTAPQPKSAYLNLYDSESKHADYKFVFENKQAGVSFKDSKAARPMKFYADGIQFSKKDGTQQYDVRDRFEDVEQEATDNAAAHGVNSSGLAAESARAQQSEGVNSASISAANTARGALQSALEAADTALSASVAAEAVARGVALSAEASSRASAVAAETAARTAAVSSLQSQISNILSDATPQVLDDLSSIVNAMQSGDQTISSALATLQNSFDDLKDRVDELTSA